MLILVLFVANPAPHKGSEKTTEVKSLKLLFWEDEPSVVIVRKATERGAPYTWKSKR